ncbi:pyocin knob domain-containing protein [Vibrio harveyi]|uniref:pyocin knob domain-containing protein n=1 Tax=Vibrio harveyi TaxID=669 RepID=UPI000682FF9E|nr:pyocin knob domain-containing protein [Vibrio harveyi]
MSDDILTIKGSELRHASSEEIELQGIGFGESDDGQGLDNFRFYLYTRETVDRLDKETNDRINYMYAVDMVNTYQDQSILGEKKFAHLQGLDQNLIWNVLGEVVLHSDGQRDTFGRNNAIARIRSEFVPRWVKPDGSVETFLTDIDGGNILERIDEVDSDSRERDEQLQRNIDDVERGSVIRDNLLQTNIDNEELARKDEDTRLHERINHMYDEDMVNTYEDQSINGVKRFERIEAQTDDVISNKNGEAVIVSDAVRDTFGRNNAITRLRSSEIPRWVKPDGSAETFLTESHGSDIGDALDELEQQVNTVDSESRQRDQVLQDNIDTEESARIAADQQLQSNIDDEETARIAADEQLQSNIDAEELARINADEALQEEIDENAAEIARLDGSKEDNISYGDPGQVAVVNDTGTGFDFIPAPSFDILKIRGAISEYTEGTDPNIFAVVSGDSLNSHLYKDTSPNSPDGDATGFSYIATEEFDAEISDGAGEITITAGDFLIWSEAAGEWTHVPVQTGARVDAINNLTGYVELVGTEGITISVNTENGRITIGIDATIARQADLLALAQRVASNEEEIYDLIQDMVYVTDKLVELEGNIGDNATAIAEVTQRVGVNETDIETLFEDFDAHIGNNQNPHDTTYDQVGAAAAVHEHTASQISDFNTAADARVRISYVGTGSEHDPDTDLAPQFISNHANSPDSSVYWHITQRFYTSASSDSNRTQLAIEYNTAANAPPRVAVRTHYSDVWTDWRFLGEGSGGSVEWDDVLNKPSTFPPSAHTHAMGEITDLDPTTLMRTIGDQTVGGTKTFVTAPVLGETAAYSVTLRRNSASNICIRYLNTADGSAIYSGVNSEFSGSGTFGWGISPNNNLSDSPYLWANVDGVYAGAQGTDVSALTRKDYVDNALAGKSDSDHNHGKGQIDVGISLGTTDLNTLNSSAHVGFYYQTANANTPGNNYPTDLAGSLTVLRAAGIIQVYRVYNTAAEYQRTFYSDAWSSWVARSTVGHTHTWESITERPSSFPPSAHQHGWADITGAPATATRWPTWDETTGKPTSFPPAAHTHSEYAPVSHTHTMANISDLSPTTIARTNAQINCTADVIAFFGTGRTEIEEALDDFVKAEGTTAYMAIAKAIEVIDEQNQRIASLEQRVMSLEGKGIE